MARQAASDQSYHDRRQHGVFVVRIDDRAWSIHQTRLDGVSGELYYRAAGLNCDLVRAW